MTGCMRSIVRDFGSLEEMSAELDDSVWSLGFRQLQKGAVKVAFSALQTEAAFILRMDLDRATHQLASMSEDVISFGLPARQQSAVNFVGRDVGSEALTLFDPQGGVDLVSPAGFAGFGVSFRRADVERHLRLMGLHEDLVGPTATLGHRPLPLREIERLRGILNNRLSMSHNGNKPLSVAQSEILDEELLGNLVGAFFHGEQVDRPSISNRVRIVRKATEYIQDHPLDVVSVEALCRASACSLSTLERAFRDYFGIAPKQYLTIARLSGVRRALLEPDSERSIGDLASVWGFWHMSKFSADYKRLFGELPSATRRMA